MSFVAINLTIKQEKKMTNTQKEDKSEFDECNYETADVKQVYRGVTASIALAFLVTGVVFGVMLSDVMSRNKYQLTQNKCPCEDESYRKNLEHYKLFYESQKKKLFDSLYREMHIYDDKIHEGTKVDLMSTESKITEHYKKQLKQKEAELKIYKLLFKSKDIYNTGASEWITGAHTQDSFKRGFAQFFEKVSGQYEDTQEKRSE